MHESYKKVKIKMRRDRSRSRSESESSSSSSSSRSHSPVEEKPKHRTILGKDVLVIGAGISGLGAAKILQ